MTTEDGKTVGLEKRALIMLRRGISAHFRSSTISQPPNHLLPTVPWFAVASELVTAMCFGLVSLFLPLGIWVSWPIVLFNVHIVVVTLSSLALALSLFGRYKGGLKPAIFLAAYTGLPNLLFLSQVFDQVKSPMVAPGVVAGFVVTGIGMLAQLAVICCCIGRLAPHDNSTACLKAGVEPNRSGLG